MRKDPIYRLALIRLQHPERAQSLQAILGVPDRRGVRHGLSSS